MLSFPARILIVSWAALVVAALPDPAAPDHPTFASPDPDLNATWDYRWQVLQRHLTYGSPATGYTFTEFIDAPFWSGAYGAISCPLGHQLAEARWLRDRRYVEDFAAYWFETPGAQPRSYSNWYGDAVWGAYLVTGDSAFLHRMLPHMIAQYEGWMREHWDAQHRMFRWDGMHDGMEVNINSRQTTDTESGGEGYRPTLNSYLFADARAIARTAAKFGDTATARIYQGRASDLKARVQRELWDPRRQFFLHQFAHDEANGVKALSRTYETGPFAGSAHGRELLGYVPWQFELPDSGYESAWRFLMDSTYFFAPFGPTTVERGDPQFMISPRCCVWSGNAWPYATSQALTAMANVLHDYRQDVITAADYVRLLQVYARAQRKDGHPYIAEAANPLTGSWSGHDTYYHSEHYFHSGYIDQVITGLVGLRPRADDTLEVHPLVPETWDWFALRNVRYRGHDVSITWDRDGRHFGRGRGLQLISDGRVIARSPTLQRLRADLGPMPVLPAVERPANVAVHNDGGAWPAVTASWSAPAASPHYLVDGHAWYDATPPNRWTSAGSPNAADSIVIDFGIERPVDWVTVYPVDDTAGVRAPAAIALYRGRDGHHDSLGALVAPAPHRGDRIDIPRVETRRLLLVVTHRPGAASGLSEIEAWTRSTAPLAPPAAAPANAAAGATATASFAAAGDDPANAVDGRIAYTLYSRNRWSTRGSPHDADTITVAWADPARINRADVHFIADGRSLAAPRAFAVQYWSGGAWLPVAERRRLPATPEGYAMNTVWFDAVSASRVRVIVTPAKPAATAITELAIWKDEP